ncbi:prepilin-type N-terminal cleavage/methylation domain-containing protein [Geobacillus subterraneus]|uniref:prepilin-type N-terminal cleavage/methylation domain-containing protein n=1 Tax=Geobacillus subterraneus TaxID=129338 RepID=UPI002AC9DF8D|nr:prepilin-type N-terminal cleavage/methylation domain-containing protein [Geobacillus subterraneus]WPZ17559.1 prepilin-type N-terminal cleavage/methylation domain-containing protein [Geobacillus subterraneus]
MLKRMIKNERGLTLIELLAVIVILGIIAAIAIPAIGGLINKSKDDAKVAEGIQIINAAKLYMTANNPSQFPVTLTTNQLDPYLDNVKDQNNDYEVEVNNDGGNGKYSYVLKNHDANNVLNDEELSEEELQNKRSNGSTDNTNNDEES